jgi:hypothetical protein
MRQYQVMILEDGEWVRGDTLTAQNKDHAAEKVREWGLDVPWCLVCL